MKADKCDIRFGVYKDQIFSLAFKNQDVEKEMFIGELHGFARMLFQMKAAKTKLIFDKEQSDIETSYGERM